MKSPSLLSALALSALPLLSGCIGTATKLATAPVRMTGKAVDMATTSQSEADEKRGRQMRERDEALAKAQRRYNKHMRQCDDGDDRACLKARDDSADIQHLRGDGAY
ncbi:hypothetical protein [Novosphingobium beihaiensis]|uniref:Lipoprotein n=1 Tax=Novosphingobium beihaiensis TaxID=2930389 RepID=A0ABT0BR51_9SPHN|nr:hypothetical protein [Novosphingobium beihaiensis]MCJ2187532.1 hypothetical protein [Novosphingobium beihaiensis]